MSRPAIQPGRAGSIPAARSLVVAPCGANAAAHAVTHWHYSRVMPVGSAVHFGVWEDSRFVGAIVFSRGANRNIASPYGLAQVECVELTRVALRRHDCPVTQALAWAVKALRQSSPGLRLVVSYADTAHGHHGGIYQAGSWLYLGPNGTGAGTSMEVRGRLLHKRTVFARYNTNSVEWVREHVDPEARWVTLPVKHRYVLPLDRGMRRALTPSALPYPPPITKS